MFTTKDPIFMDYFTILAATPALYELKSNNTGHFWKLIKMGNVYRMMHKHNEKDKYHYQTDTGNLYDSILYIVSHDEFQLRGRKHISFEHEKKHESLFWKLIENYGLYA